MLQGIVCLVGGVSDLVIGLTVVAIGTSLPELATSIPAATVVLVPIVWNGFQIKRWEGVVLIAFYAAYVAYLVLDA